MDDQELARGRPSAARARGSVGDVEPAGGATAADRLAPKADLHAKFRIVQRSNVEI